MSTRFLTKINSNEQMTPWWSTSLGQAMLERSHASVQKLIPQHYYRVALQVSQFNLYNFLDTCQADIRFHVGTFAEEKLKCHVIAEPEWLPFAAKSVDLLVLAHVLEFSAEPQNVFREVSECIAPEGILVITGFNPSSFLGLMKYLNRLQGINIQQAKFLSILRVRDWLSLLGFESLAGKIVFYQLPSISGGKKRQQQLLEKAGNRWWPGLGAVYIIVARKKEPNMIMNRNQIFSRKLKHRRSALLPAVEKTILKSHSGRR